MGRYVAQGRHLESTAEYAGKVGIVAAADFPRTSAGLLNACNTAVAEGRELIVSDDYEIGSSVSLPSNLTMRGVGNDRPVIRYDGSTSSDTLKITNVSNVSIDNILVDGGQDNGFVSGNCIEVSGSTNVRLTRVKTRLAADQAVLVWNGSTRVYLDECDISDTPTQEGMAVKNASYVYVRRSLFENNQGFGFFAENASHLYIDHNDFLDNYIEGVGLRYDVTHGDVSHNRVRGGNDNGISITGQWFTALANQISDVAFHGGCFFGSNNIAAFNHAKNVGQAGGGAGYAGWAVSPGFGGTGENNIIVANFFDDDQATMTMDYGVKLNTGTYTAWANGQTITVSGGSYAYRKHSNRLYVALNSGTTATGSEPVHTSGTVTGADGIQWEYIATTTALIDFCATGNKVGLNSIGRRNVEDYHMSNVTHFNSIIGHDFLRLSARNGAEASYNFIDLIAYAGSPESNLSASPGAVVFRRNSSSVFARSMYGKHTGTGTTGWGNFQLNETYATASRPTLAASDAGAFYFDSTLNKPLWWDSANWRDAAGTIS